jgi:hypothetical protein
MADGTLLSTLSPATCYATKKNLVFPGKTAAASAAATAADTRIEDALPSGATVAGLTVPFNNE